MDFDWDPVKAEKTQRERGIAFEDAAKVFGDPNRLDWPDERRTYPEPRRVTVGIVETVFITVVYTMQGDLCRIITAWPANRKERKAYGPF